MPLGPRRIAGTEVIYRGLAGFIGGAVAAIITLITIVFGGNIAAQITGGDMQHPLILFFIMIILLFTTSVSNVLSTFIISKTNKKKYVDVSRAIMQVLAANIITFLLLLPMYIIISQLNIGALTYILGLHLMFATLFSDILFEVISTRTNQILILLYSTIVGFLFAVVFAVLFFTLGQAQNVAVLLLPIIPIVTWTTIGIVGALIEYLYYIIFKVFGIDFLNIDLYSDNQKETSL